MQPVYDLDKIKFGTGEPTYSRAVGLYENGKITKFEKDFRGYSAIVLGTHPYRVYVSSRHYDRGSCDCYLGQRDELCKHMVAVSIFVVMGGKKLSDKDKEMIIAQALETDEGRTALAQAMVEPIRRSLE